MNHGSISRASIALVTTLVCTYAMATPKETRRYPFDPSCAWGRLSDGKGLIVRCLSRDESERLARTVPATGSGTPAGAAAVPTSAPTTAGPTAPGGAVAAEPIPVPAAPPPPPTTPTAPTAAAPSSGVTAPGVAVTTDSLVAELVAVTADDGELPLAKKKLGVPLDRYVKCVAENGGLTANSGQVDIEFLVRERGRAEGANVAKFQGMSEAAANCIAQVVDRRPTGVPEAPLVTAHAVIRVRKKNAK